MTKVITTGIIGLGRIGKLHAANIQNSIEGMQVKTAVDVVITEEAAMLMKKLGIENVGTDADRIFNDPEIDAVIICSSTDTHTDFIVRAAKAGKHIFCEKPIGSDVASIEAALREVRKAGVALQLGFVRRFDHNHKAVREAVHAGKIGKPEIVKITSRDPAAPPEAYVRTSGGLFFDMMIHDFDMACYLAGSQVTEVFTYGKVLVDDMFGKLGDVDTAIVSLVFENGAIGVIDNSRRAPYGYDQRVEVHGALGCVQDTNDVGSTCLLSTADGVAAEKPLWFFLERYNAAFIAELQAFTQAVSDGKDVAVSGEDGLAAIKIAMAAKKSLDEKRPVSISEIK
jgi:myo-inositol 2-dehydrogenase/D-chiro-inositol 1-dehydrogenase